MTKTTQFIKSVGKLANESITLTDPKFTDEEDYDFYTSIYGVSPKTVEVGYGSITLTFDPQEIDMTVKVGVR